MDELKRLKHGRVVYNMTIKDAELQTEQCDNGDYDFWEDMISYAQLFAITLSSSMDSHN